MDHRFGGVRVDPLSKLRESARAMKTVLSLKLLAWLSPAFPTGAFAYSHGLEWAVEVGDVTDEASLLAWLTDVLLNGTGRTDTILLRHGHHAASDARRLIEIAALALATSASRERRDEALAQGKAFVRAAAEWRGPGTPQSAPT